jgi:hypothetical protein
MNLLIEEAQTVILDTKNPVRPVVDQRFRVCINLGVHQQRRDFGPQIVGQKAGF